MSIDKHHPTLNVSINYNQFNILPVSKSFYSFKNCNYLNIIKYSGDSFSNHDFNSSDVNILTNQLYSILYKAVDIFVPIKCIPLNSFPKWYSSKLKLLIKEKKIAHLAYKQTNNIYNYNNFSQLRAKCKSLAKLDYNNYIIKSQ